ncbi:MAG: hypothetical protein AB7F89_14325 [Pirellulaceae bacterium]
MWVWKICQVVRSVSSRFSLPRCMPLVAPSNGDSNVLGGAYGLGGGAPPNPPASSAGLGGGDAPASNENGDGPGGEAGLGGGAASAWLVSGTSTIVAH